MYDRNVKYERILTKLGQMFMNMKESPNFARKYDLTVESFIFEY